MATKTATNVIRIDGEISPESMKAVREKLDTIPADQDLTLRINSPGGSIFDGQGLITALKERTGSLTTINEALAASMAAVIFAVGSKRLMAEGARLMIHKPWTGGTTGESDDLRREADLLDSLETDITSVFVNATGLETDRVSEMLASETWMTAEEAKGFGFATDIITGPTAVIPASFLAKFEHVPAELMGGGKGHEALPSNVIDLQNLTNKLRSDLQARTKERDDARANLAKTKVLLDALKRSCGLGAAIVVPPIESNPVGAAADPIMEKWNEIAGTSEGSRFYDENRAHILANAHYIPKAKR